MSRSRALSTALALLALLACARNPVTGRPQVVLVSTEREKELGREAAKEVEASLGLVEQAVLEGWVREIGDQLAAHSPRQDVDYTFRVVDMPEPNAFALPGGPVYVSRGLLALVNEEDELAGVLGHEIAHVAARHAVTRNTLAVPLAIVLGLPSAIVGTVSPVLGDVVGGVGGLATGFVIAPYGRSQEREADRLGVELVAQAGWDPAALSRFLRTLERHETLELGRARRRSFFDTHPSTPSRAADSAAHAARLSRAPGDPIAGTPRELLARLDGLLIGPNPVQGVFADGLFLHPDLGFALRFPEGWETQNAPQFVAAQSPDERAVVLLQLSGEHQDPLEAAKADGLDEKSAAELESLEIGGLPAARLVRTSRGSVLELTWIVLGERAYRIVGLTPERGDEAQRASVRAAAESFHPLLRSERAKIREDRLRSRAARAGESLEAFVERTGGTWSAAETAVANGVIDDVALERGRRLKVPIRQRYTPKGG